MHFIEIYNWLIDQFRNNQFFAGVAIPFALASAAYLLRSIPNKIYHWCRLILTLEFTLTSRNNHYDEILKFLYNHRFKFFSRNYSISHNSAHLTPGYGVSMGIYNGVIFIFNREIFEQKLDLQEKTHITFLTRDLKFINKFFDDCKKKDHDNSIHVFSQAGTYFIRMNKRPKRSLETVFVNNHIKEDIIEKIKWFLANEQYYIDRGISYKICFLLHGIPGTGKSSLIHAIASYFNYNIKLINDLVYIHRALGDKESDDVAYDSPAEIEEGGKALYVIEDIDCLNVSKRDEEPESVPARDAKTFAPIPPPAAKNSDQYLTTLNNRILQQILNALDGIGTPHNRIIFITTNKIEALDHALIRKGRIDHAINIDKLNEEQFIYMFISFFGEHNKHFVTDFIEHGFYTPQIGANLSDIFLNNTPEKALELIKND